MINGFFIWDKVSNINGNKASVVLDSDESFKDNTVVFFTNNNKPVVHALVENLRVELNMLNQTDEEVCQLKLNKLIEESKNQEKEQIALEEQAKKISILQEENEKLKESQASQDMDIMFTQEAVDFLMLGSMSTNLKNIKLGGSNMAGYIATRIMKKGDISIEAGRNYYVTFLTHQDYAKYRAEVDLILISEGRENLIVDLTNL